MVTPPQQLALTSHQAWQTQVQLKVDRCVRNSSECPLKFRSWLEGVFFLLTRAAALQDHTPPPGQKSQGNIS